MGLVAFCGFVLPWIAVAVWLYTTQIKPYHTGVPWRTLARYPGPADGPPQGRHPEGRVLTGLDPVVDQIQATVAPEERSAGGHLH